MTRSILTALAVAVFAVACLGTGCQATGVGDPCTPEQEYDPTFAGFVEQEVSTEGESFQCQTRLCLVNHFQGRVSCPYGQDATGKKGNGPATSACVLPGISQVAVTGPLAPGGKPLDPMAGYGVLPQCTDRQAKDAVYCSCRCADINGAQTGGNFCTCPDGFACTQLVSSLSAGQDQGLTGAYCIKNGTAFSASATSTGGTGCAGSAPCGSTAAADCGNVNNTGGS